MFGFIKKLFTSKQDRDLGKLGSVVDAVNAYWEEYQHLSDDDLRGKSLEFKARIKEYLKEYDAELAKMQENAAAEEDLFNKDAIFKEIDTLKKERNEALEEILTQLMPEAFATIKEASRRFKENTEIHVTATDHDRALAAQPSKTYVSIEGDTAVWKNHWKAAGGDIVWNMMHYDVQLMGGRVLHEGKVAEMMTGEGKTLVGTLPAYLNGLSGEGVHMVTVNEYLARRDCEWVGPVYEYLHLTVDCIDRYRPNSEDRKKAYRADIVFGTNNEFGFDYLRDNMSIDTDDLVQRSHHFAIVDEVDSVLIDDARTPLIISGPVSQGTEEQEYIELNPTVKRLIEEQSKLATQFLAEARRLQAEGKVGTEEGTSGMALLRAHRALPKHRALIKYLSEEGSKVLLQKTEGVYMEYNNKRMPEVDRPLLFTIDEKNRSVELTEKGVEFLSRYNNNPDFFVMPDIVTELMKIDADNSTSKDQKIEAKELLAQDYSIKGRRLHTISQLLKAHTLFEIDVEYILVDGEVKIVDEQTGRVMEGRRYSDGLHQALEAKENVRIGDITQTYATITLQNYFRMFHKLAGMTGTAETEAKELWDIYKLDVVVIPTNRPLVRKDEEDLVFKTAREKYNAVIDEIVHLSNAGRPVLVGTTSVEISELLSRMLRMRGIEHNVLNAKQHQREAEIVAEAGHAGKVTIATNMAGRGTDIKLGLGVKEAGGLAIIGTERHDSRRVDRQLRGRAGRQGDPGSSQFYVSLEDNLMRLFQSDRIASMMDKMGHKEGEVIQHSMVTKSIEKAQIKVEENNFGIRKRLLEYDDVMNVQRTAIYGKRRNALFGDKLAMDLNQAFSSITSQLVEAHRQGGDFDTFRFDSLAATGVDPEMEESFFKSAPLQEVIDTYQRQVFEIYHRKSNHVSEVLLPVIKDISAQPGNQFKRIIVPFSDGNKGQNVSADMTLAVETEGKSIMRDIEKIATLAQIDDAWKEHLRNMDELKDSVQSASFEQKDPLVIYKMEAYNLFEHLIGHINANVTSYLLKGTLVMPERPPATVNQAPRPATPRLQTNIASEMTETQKEAKRAGEAVSQAAAAKPKPIMSEKLVGRNDPCPCGSGKKFKQCHGK